MRSLGTILIDNLADPVGGYAIVDNQTSAQALAHAAGKVYGRRFEYGPAQDGRFAVFPMEGREA